MVVLFVVSLPVVELCLTAVGVVMVAFAALRVDVEVNEVESDSSGVEAVRVERTVYVD